MLPLALLLLLAAARPELLVVREDPALRVRSFMAFCFDILEMRKWELEGNAVSMMAVRMMCYIASLK